MNIAAGENAAGGELSDKLFLAVMRQIAYRDTAFAKQQIDRVEAILTTTGITPDVDNPEDVASTSIEFHAQRLRHDTDSGDTAGDVKRPDRSNADITYEIGKVVMLDYITLPPEIAVHVFDDAITRHVATEQKSFKRELKEHFRISTTNRLLRACECVEHFDADGEPIYGGCPWNADDETESIDQGTSAWLNSIGIANTTETSENGDSMSFAQAFEEEQHDKDLRAAMGLVREFHKQLFIIAGVELPKQ